MTRALVRCMVIIATVIFSGCASLQGRDPVQAYVVGVQPLQGQGLELRMLLKLRVQNPNDTPITYDGVSVGMEVQGRNFASGVTDASGTIPRFGEAVINVPVSISALRVLRGAAGVLNSPGDRIAYELKGKLAGAAFKTIRFNSKGEFTLPDGFTATARPTECRCTGCSP